MIHNLPAELVLWWSVSMGGLLVTSSVGMEVVPPEYRAPNGSAVVGHRTTIRAVLTSSLQPHPPARSVSLLFHLLNTAAAAEFRGCGFDGKVGERWRAGFCGGDRLKDIVLPFPWRDSPHTE